MRDRAQAKAFNFLEAARLDEVRDDCQSHADIGAVFVGQVRNAVQELAPAANFSRESPQPLFCTNVHVDLSTWIELGRHGLKGVFGNGLCGRLLVLFGGCGFLFTATCERQESQDGEHAKTGPESSSFHMRSDNWFPRAVPSPSKSFAAKGKAENSSIMTG